MLTSWCEQQPPGRRRRFATVIDDVDEMRQRRPGSCSCAGRLPAVRNAARARRRSGVLAGLLAAAVMAVPACADRPREEPRGLRPRRRALRPPGPEQAPRPPARQPRRGRPGPARTGCWPGCPWPSGSGSCSWWGWRAACWTPPRPRRSGRTTSARSASSPRIPPACGGRGRGQPGCAVAVVAPGDRRGPVLRGRQPGGRRGPGAAGPGVRDHAERRRAGHAAPRPAAAPGADLGSASCGRRGSTSTSPRSWTSCRPRTPPRTRQSGS